MNYMNQTDMTKFKILITRLSFIFLIFSLVSCGKSVKREAILLSGEWSFAIDSTGAGETGNWALNGIPTELGRIVNVPHTWKTEPNLGKYDGKAWYQRSIHVANDQLSKTTRIQFDAVYHDAFVYINGQKAGEHIGSGYNRFFIDASPFLKAGENTITVCVDNSLSRSNIPFMESYDWANDGGIYRNVYQLVTDPIAIRNIHVAAVPEGEKGKAKIKVYFVDPSLVDLQRIKIEATISEENQATQSVIYQSPLDGKIENGFFETDLNFEKINLWHFDAPNLYKIDVKLLVDGIEKDQFSTVFGFRTIKIENNRYVLNGEPMRLMGVEWMPGSTLERGMAETEADLAANLDMMKKANCIFTRFHWQQDEFVFDWCDRHGILVQEEIPYWGIWTLLNDTMLNKGFQHIDEMTDAHFNHPSIISWGIGNELLAHEQLEKVGLKKLYDHVKNIDPSRLSTYVTNSLHFDMPSENPERYDATYDFDMMMFNEYYSTHYHKTIDVIPGELDRLAREYPGKPMTISEWGLCDPVLPGGDERRAREMAQQMEIYGSKPYIAGAIYFCLNDYRTQRSEDYSRGYPLRDHGVCDAYLIPKKSFETLKTVSSPVEIRNIVNDYGQLRVTLAGRTGLPSYTLRNYYLVTGNYKVVIDELKPSEEKTYDLPTRSSVIRIFRPTGYEVLSKSL